MVLESDAMGRQRSGQGMVEYSLILALVAIVAIVILTVLGSTVSEVYSNVVCDLQHGTCSGPPASPVPSPSPSPSPVPLSYQATILADSPSGYWRLDSTPCTDGGASTPDLSGGSDSAFFRNDNNNSITCGNSANGPLNLGL